MDREGRGMYFWVWRNFASQLQIFGGKNLWRTWWQPGNPYRGRRLIYLSPPYTNKFRSDDFSTDNFISLFTKQVALTLRRSTVLSLSLKLVFPGQSHSLALVCSCCRICCNKTRAGKSFKMLLAVDSIRCLLIFQRVVKVRHTCLVRPISHFTTNYLEVLKMFI